MSPSPTKKRPIGSPVFVLSGNSFSIDLGGGVGAGRATGVGVAAWRIGATTGSRDMVGVATCSAVRKLILLSISETAREDVSRTDNSLRS